MIIYVDDGVIFGDYSSICAERNLIFTKFNGRTEDPVLHGQWLRKSFLGVAIWYNKCTRSLKIEQTAYAQKLVKKFGSSGKFYRSTSPVVGHIYNRGALASKEMFDYQSCIGSLMYLAVQTRPDIMYAVGQLGRYMSQPRSSAVDAALRVIEYIKNTIDRGLEFNNINKFRDIAGDATVVGFCDSDFGMCKETRKSVSGNVIFYRGTPVWWKSSIQKIIATSSAEAEYISLYSLTKQLSEIGNVATHILGSPQSTVPIIFCDNGSAISIAQSAGATKGMKHIDIKYHYVRKELKDGKINIKWIPTKNQLADGLTKPVSKDILRKLVSGDI